MITNLRIDGYKSLKNFEINFTKGLNVLVGPNGVGKTNICQALSILSSLSNNDLLNQLTQFGGVQSTFNIIESFEDQRAIIVSANGETTGIFKKRKYSIKYYYSIKLGLTDELVFLNEELKIRRKTDNNTWKSVLKVEQNEEESQRENIITINVVDPDFVGEFPFLKSGKQSIKFDLQQQESFIPLLSRLSYICWLVYKEFTKIKSFNIDPHISRASCDVTEPSEMLGTGRYLSNSLHFLEKQGEDLSEINALLKQLLPNYERIRSATSHSSLKRTFYLHDIEENIFPANSLSDGTVKLIALLVGIVAQNEKTTIIEEPENYLHPYANKLLIQYLRETYEDGVCILTTHSETILNFIDPSELIICELAGSFTRCSRIQNLRKIRKVINDSGFGCGYHYLAGNLGGVPRY
jgi:predicted ATPase